ncbi:hypothetical protein A1O1_04804 [Capronia coronata CBS 617.96]|uniref:Tautomerase cis-CaaD-like domain-containing protein n=1 Tax=Capronia coronata CBS 617.96 TaxID=1182541 RepID=W9Y513_9EURO|nr:uncharacterized protein A1O1_04804 [Capronia coronata CBS 617.96]EXJ87877.1 hypothetical protein A1O1_04804 [Capronia coronata CBS 617.96]
MPLWRDLAHSQTFTPSQRDTVSKSHRLVSPAAYWPAFYVNVDDTQVWVGGESRSSFVRIVVEQIARTTFEAVPHRQDQLDWKMGSELYETPGDLWRLRRLDPPPFPDKEKKLAEANRLIAHM